LQIEYEHQYKERNIYVMSIYERFAFRNAIIGTRAVELLKSKAMARNEKNKELRHK
jgi:hypothetical protein